MIFEVLPIDKQGFGRGNPSPTVSPQKKEWRLSVTLCVHGKINILQNFAKDVTHPLRQSNFLRQKEKWCPKDITFEFIVKLVFCKTLPKMLLIYFGKATATNELSQKGVAWYPLVVHVFEVLQKFDKSVCHDEVWAVALHFAQSWQCVLFHYA